MHGGLIFQLRQSIEHARYAKPWQQALLSAALVLVGVGLVVKGDFIGLMPAVLGLLFIRPAIRNQLRARGARQRECDRTADR